MRFLVLAAIIVAVSSGRLNDNSQQKSSQENESQWPWQVGKEYQYEVESHTLASLPESASTGNAFRARFTLRVKAPGKIQAKLENPEHAQVHQVLEKHEPMPDDLKYKPAPNLEKPFEIHVKGGRVQSMRLPASVPLAQENLLKGLISALQVDLSTHRNKHSHHDTYDNEVKQGVFRKMETDVTGDCETLYTVSPVAAEWRRELPHFAENEEPIEITKTKDYRHCHYRVDYHFGVPAGAEWNDAAIQSQKDLLISRGTFSRALVAKNGPIYKAETTSSVFVSPHLYGKQKAQVHSKVSLKLVTYKDNNQDDWETSEESREIKNLLYSVTQKQFSIGESESSSSSSESQENVRQRRSAHPKTNISINKENNNRKKNKGSSSSSSSSESAYVNDEIPQNNEPAYAALYMNPQTSDKKQNPVNAQKLAQELAQLLQNPNNMPKSDFFSKFNILVRVIASMSSSQLTQASRSMEAAKSHKDAAKSDMWKIYRDAVVESGTLPAFQQIKSWIQNQNIKGDEAAHVVSVLSRSLRYPTKEAMTQFFDMAMSPEVREQRWLNTTSLIAATSFIYTGHVNKKLAHDRYPSHMYGKLSGQNDDFVPKNFLPRLKEQLEKAIQDGDSHKTQVYIKAIGNLGHRSILNVFAPYLEGKEPVSTYIRARMVENLRPLAGQQDKHAIAALYSILRNTAEPYEVRVAAIHSIFLANPTNAQMQAVAEMTQNDPSIEVRAVLKSAIQSVSELKDPLYLKLVRSTNSGKDLLTKEKFGAKYSSKVFTENFNEDESDSLNVFSSTGSEDSLFPKTLRYFWKNRKEGYDNANMFSLSSSSSQKLADMFTDLAMETLFNKETPKSDNEPNHKYSARKISEKLNIKREKEDPLEAALLVNILNQNRFFAISESDKQEIAELMKKSIAEISEGSQYTNIFYRNQVSIMFPVASGMPFIFKYKEPTLVYTKGQVKAEVQSQQNNKYNVESDKQFHVTLAQNNDGSVGFLDTLSNQIASVGVVKKIQIHLALKSRVEAKNGEVKLEVMPINPEQDTTVVHHSVWPYSANQPKETLVTVSHDQNTKLISRPNKVISFDTKFGQQFGTVFQVQGYSYSEDYRRIENIWQSNNPIRNIIAAFKQNDVAQTHFNLRYLGKQSKSKGVSITAVYDMLHNQKQEGQMSPIASNPKDVTPNSANRREELIKRVVTGIDTANAIVLDLSAKFKSPQKLEYALTFAVARSPVDPKVQYAFYAGRNSDQLGQGQINVAASVTKPTSTSSMNFREALKKDLKMKFEADIRYGQKENIHIKGETERTKKYAEELEKLPSAKQCIEQASQGNNYQHQCHKAIVMAHAPDNFKASVTYKDLSNGVRRAASQILNAAQNMNWQVEINPSKTSSNSGDGKLEIVAEAHYLRQALDVKINSNNGEQRFKNIPIPKATPAALATYAPIGPVERVLNVYTKHQYQPYCTVDNTKVRTFSDREYNYTLTRSWHVVMQSQKPGKQEQLVVMTRRQNPEKLEMYISYRSPYGKDLEIEVQPAQDGSKQPQVKVNTNANKVSDGKLKIYWDNEQEEPILEHYTDEDGVLIMNIRENYLRTMYDGKTLVAWANKNRKNNRGICGYMSGEPRDDYNTPNGLVDKPEHYGASYALNENDGDPKTKELQEQAKNYAYQPEKKYTTILRSDKQWQKSLSSSSSSESEEWGANNIYRARSYSKQQEPCSLRNQVQYYENYGEICITTKPLPACQSHCSSGDHQVQGAQVVCRPKLDQEFQSLRDQIRKGQNPKVTGVPQIKQYRVPGSCKA